MNLIEKKIFNEYDSDCFVEAISYEAMGKMLDENYVKERFRMFDLRELYIYGGTYLAVQLYRVGKRHVDIRGIVDRSGKLIMDEEASVITLDELKNIYSGETIVITPLRYFHKIRNELLKFVEDKNIVGIGELLLGIV